MANDEKKEIKRIREKERRREVSKAYQELSTLITEVGDKKQTSFHDSIGSMGELSAVSHHERTRIQLVNDAISLIRSLHDDNVRLRSQLKSSSDRHDTVCVRCGCYV